MPQNKFETLWNDAKTIFGLESEGRKKPSEKALGFFRKSSGLAKAATGLDKALAGIEPEALQKSAVAALAAFRAAKTAYLRTLTTALEREAESPAYRTACRNLERTLNDMPGSFESDHRTRIQEALDTKLTELLKKGVLDKKSLERAADWLQESKDKSLELSTMISKGTLPKGKDLEILKATFKAAKQELLAFETNVVPVVNKYLKMFGVQTVTTLPSSPEVSVQLSNMYSYYIDFTKGQGPRIQSLIDEWEEAKSQLTAKKIAAFDKFQENLTKLAKRKDISEAIFQALRLIREKAKAVNQNNEAFTKQLLPYLADLKTHAKKIDVDFKPIDSLVADLNKQIQKPFDGDKISGADVSEWFVKISRGMKAAIKPFRSI